MKDVFELICICSAVALSIYCRWSAKRLLKHTDQLQKDVEVMVFSRSKYIADFALHKYYADHPERLKWLQSELPERTAICHLLFAIHTHGELCTTDEIVYREDDIIILFKSLGFEVNWGE